MNFSIESVDLGSDTVQGTASSNQTVQVWTCWESEPCIDREETADPAGNWTASFAVPGDQPFEQQTADLRVGSWIDSSINDEDGDSTLFGLTAEPIRCQPGNSVSGTVYEHDGTTPITIAQLQIEEYATGNLLFTANVDQNGHFGCALPDGNYRILALAENYSQEYFDQTNATNATLLTISTGTQLANINFTLSRLPAIEHYTFNLDNILLQELAVRQAIALGTDRQRILNQAFLPSNLFGLVSNSIVPPEHWAAAPASELTVYPYDPVQAQSILETAGWINRDADVFRENAGGTELAFTFKTTDAAYRVEAAEIFRQNMEQIGIRITVEHIPSGEFFGAGGVVVNGNFDIAEFAWANAYDDETYLESYVSGHTENHGNYTNSAFDIAMSNAESATSDVERLPYLYTAQGILTQDLPILPLFTRINVAPVPISTGGNVTVSPQNYLDIHFNNVTEGGVTTVLETDVNPADLPPNFQLLGQVYDVGTSAIFDSAQVCFSYDASGLTLGQETGIRLFHLENGTWMDVTDSGYPDLVNHVVCGTVTSFSPFVVMFPPDSTPPVITWISEIEDGDTFHFGFVPAAPTCVATDNGSGMNGECAISGYFTSVGSHTLIATASDLVGNTVTKTRVYTVLAWTLKGFYQPVDMNGIQNLVKGGSTVSLKFEIFAGMTELTDPAFVGGLSYAETSCNANAITDEIELTTTGNTTLRYDVDSGQFVYNWKTPRSPGKCYRVTLITDDGTALHAYFKFK